MKRNCGDDMHWILKAMERRADLLIMLIVVVGLFFIAWLYLTGG